MKCKINVDFKNMKAEFEGENGIEEIIEEIKKFNKFADSLDFVDRREKGIETSEKNPILNYNREKYSGKEYPEEVLKLSNYTKIEPEELLKIYDFGDNTETPPLLIDIKKNTRTGQQRIGLLLILFANKILHGDDRLSSQALSEILTKSMIDPTELNKALNKSFQKYVRLDGRTYRILHQGIIEAQKTIETYIENKEE